MTILRRTAGSVGLLLAVGLVAAPSAASATTCVADHTVADELTQVDAVFVGTPTSTDTGVVTVAVSDVYQGAVDPVVAVQQPTALDVVEPFDTGVQYVIFADRDGDAYAVPPCSHTGPVSDELLAELEVAAVDREAYRPMATAAPTTGPTGPTVEPTEPVEESEVDVATPQSASDDSVDGPWAAVAVLGAGLAVAVVGLVPVLRRRRRTPAA